MSYGLQVNSVVGEPKIFDGSWFMSFHSNHSHYVSEGASKTVVIQGFDPGRWGIYNLSILYPRNYEAAWNYITAKHGKIYLHNGYIVLHNTSGSVNITFNFTVLKGN